jgi:Restriction endonuclease
MLGVRRPASTARAPGPAKEGPRGVADSSIMPDTWDLVEEYGRLTRLEGHSPQSRGQRLNGVVADLLRRHSIEAAENVSGAGELDATFSVGGRRFIVEAKWEQSPTATGAIAKLQKRVRQRLQGTIGLFVSMSGYTPAAIADVKDGDRLEVLLLDRSHLEAMLSGFVPPEELVTVLLDYASYRGDFYVDLGSLLEDNAPVTPLRIVEEPEELAGWLADWFSEDRPSVKRLVRGFPAGWSGLSVAPQGHLLVTTAQGAFEVDLHAGAARPTHRLRDCFGRAMIMPEGVYVARREGVARLDDTGIHPVLGGAPTNPILVLSEDGRLYALLNRSWNGSGGQSDSTRLVEIPSTLGGSCRTWTLDYPPHSAVNAAVLDDGRFLIVGSGGVRVMADGTTTTIGFNGSNAMGLARRSRSRYYCIADSQLLSLYELDIDIHVSQELGRFNLAATGASYLVRWGDSLYLMCHTPQRLPTIHGLSFWSCLCRRRVTLVIGRSGRIQFARFLLRYRPAVGRVTVRVHEPTEWFNQVQTGAVYVGRYVPS